MFCHVHHVRFVEIAIPLTLVAVESFLPPIINQVWDYPVYKANPWWTQPPCGVLLRHELVCWKIVEPCLPLHGHLPPVQVLVRLCTTQMGAPITPSDATWAWRKLSEPNDGELSVEIWIPYLRSLFGSFQDTILHLGCPAFRNELVGTFWETGAAFGGTRFYSDLASSAAQSDGTGESQWVWLKYVQN